MLRSVIIVFMLLSTAVQAQYRTRQSQLHQTSYLYNRLETLKKQSSEVAFNNFQTTPVFINYGGYWRGLMLRDTSQNGIFTSTYFYDVQGNLRETKSYLNIKNTNWSIQISPQRQARPSFVLWVR